MNTPGGHSPPCSTTASGLPPRSQHRQPPAVPYNFMFSPPARARLEAHYGTADVEAALGLPLRIGGPKSIKPLYASPAEFGPTRQRRVRRRSGAPATSTAARPIGPCLPEADLSGYRFPDAAAAYRFEASGRVDGRATPALHHLWSWATCGSGPRSCAAWSTSCSTWPCSPQFVEELLRGLADYILQTMEILFARFRFDGIALSDDYGTQRGMLMSPAHWRRFIRPLLAEIYGLAKKHGRTVFHHTLRQRRADHRRPDRHRAGHPAPHPARGDGHLPAEAGVRRAPDLLRRRAHAGPAAARHARAGPRRGATAEGRAGHAAAATSSSRASPSRPTCPLENLVALVEESTCGVKSVSNDIVAVDALLPLKRRERPSLSPEGTAVNSQGREPLGAEGEFRGGARRSGRSYCRPDGARTAQNTLPQV